MSSVTIDHLEGCQLEKFRDEAHGNFGWSLVGGTCTGSRIHTLTLRLSVPNYDEWNKRFVPGDRVVIKNGKPVKVQK